MTEAVLCDFSLPLIDTVPNVRTAPNLQRTSPDGTYLLTPKPTTTKNEIFALRARSPIKNAIDMSHEDVSDRESKTIIERLIHLARTGKARIERRTVERIGITAPGADYPAIFITIDTDGDPITCNYVTDGMDDEDLHFTDENTLAELLSHRD